MQLRDKKDENQAKRYRGYNEKVGQAFMKSYEKGEIGKDKINMIKNCQPRILYPVQLSYKNKCEIKML